jgi:hypothetical protein
MSWNSGPGGRPYGGFDHHAGDSRSSETSAAYERVERATDALEEAIVAVLKAHPKLSRRDAAIRQRRLDGGVLHHAVLDAKARLNALYEEPRW